MPKGGSGAGVEPRLAQNVQDRALWSRRARRVPEKSHSAQRLHGTRPSQRCVSGGVLGVRSRGSVPALTTSGLAGERARRGP